MRWINIDNLSSKKKIVYLIEFAPSIVKQIIVTDAQAKSDK